VALCVAAVVVPLLASGCGPQTVAALRMPECRADNSTILLMAQSVPTAFLLPCIRSLPTGWSFDSFDVRNGISSFWLDNDRAGTRALGVSLQKTCLPLGTPVPTDKPGSVLYVKIDSLGPRFKGARYYRFSKECLIYRFSFPADDRASFTVDATNAIGSVTRAAVARYVSQYGFTL
jgi:hypothetical protein